MGRIITFWPILRAGWIGWLGLGAMVEIRKLSTGAHRLSDIIILLREIVVIAGPAAARKSACFEPLMYSHDQELGFVYRVTILARLAP